VPHSGVKESVSFIINHAKCGGGLPQFDVHKYIHQLLSARLMPVYLQDSCDEVPGVWGNTEDGTVFAKYGQERS
jgi:hypothetical protein